MKINIVRPVLPNLKHIKKDFDKCLKNGQVTNNSKNVKLFENNLKKFFNSKFKPVVFCNGQMAFFSLIQAWRFKLKLKDNEKIFALVPSFTWSGTINSLILNNIKPIFCDVDDTFTLDIKKLDHKLKKINTIRKKIKFIIPVSNYGNITDINALKKLCKKHKLISIMDSAPAFGSKFKNKHPNNFGIDEIYSFHATKIMTSMEGGCVISNNSTILKYCMYIRDFGQYEKTIGNIKLPGLNSKMQEISAIVGNYNLARSNRILKKRTNVIKKYNLFFSTYKKKKIFTLMKTNQNVFCTYLYYPLVVEKNIKKFKKYLKNCNISFRKYYSAVHTLEYYKKNKINLNLGLEFTNSIKDKIIALPLFSYMSQKEINYIFNKINKFYKI